jgi:hypothetical protein
MGGLMNRNSIRCVLVLAALGAAMSPTPSFGAGTIKGVFQNLVGPTRARLGANGQVVVAFNLLGVESPVPAFMRGPTVCRYQIWTDVGGTKQHWEFNEMGTPMFPKHPSVTFTKAGRTSVSVVPVGNTGCEGSVHTEIDIDPPAPAPAAAPSCPQGWNLVTRNEGTGSFRCAPAKPSPVPCPPGTRWFDDGGSVGCRP